MTKNETLDKQYDVNLAQIKKKHMNPVTGKPYNQQAYDSAVETLNRNFESRVKDIRHGAHPDLALYEHLVNPKTNC
ncbi:MAG: hypothetical protein FWC51_03180 [Proteobacteria bacterium]|nr:hypothetical protein [Pseudomonadota bacterium]